MQRTTVFLARISEGNGKFPFVSVKIKHGKPITPDRATTYYARYSGVRKDGSRAIVEALGDNIETAYVQFLNIDTAQKQIRAGHTPSFTGTAIATDKGSLVDAIEQYLEDSKSIGNDADTLGSKSACFIAFRKSPRSVESLPWKL